jgi:hypothetical protein
MSRAAGQGACMLSQQPSLSMPIAANAFRVGSRLEETNGYFSFRLAGANSICVSCFPQLSQANPHTRVHSHDRSPEPSQDTLLKLAPFSPDRAPVFDDHIPPCDALCCTGTCTECAPAKKVPFAWAKPGHGSPKGTKGGRLGFSQWYSASVLRISFFYFTRFRFLLRRFRGFRLVGAKSCQPLCGRTGHFLLAIATRRSESDRLSTTRTS